MIPAYLWTRLFYLLVSVLAITPLLFVRSIWRKSRSNGWNWISRDSRNMYVDGARTLITASGIAVALLASSAVSAAKATNAVLLASARTAVVCLISCICLSVVVILALSRGYEQAQARYIEEQRNAGKTGEVVEGRLSRGELLFILVPSAIALSCFLVGIVFLGRVTFHF